MNTDRESSLDPALVEPDDGVTGLDELRSLARKVGADGVFTLRGVQQAELLYQPAGSDEVIHLVLAPDHPMLFLALFSASDGREPGIES